jgi:beta-lactamase regulating signal transducer with metallopeptidase domain
MKKRKSNKIWLFALLIFIILLTTISFTITENYKTNFEGLSDRFSSMNTENICDLSPINYGVHPLGLNVKDKDSISRFDILKAAKLESEDKRFEIISFSVGIGDDCFRHGLYSEIPCDKNVISDQAKERIKIYRKGGPISFECIAAKTKAGKIFRLKSVIYFLKD